VEGGAVAREAVEMIMVGMGVPGAQNVGGSERGQGGMNVTATATVIVEDGNVNGTIDEITLVAATRVEVQLNAIAITPTDTLPSHTSIRKRRKASEYREIFPSQVPPPTLMLSRSLC
jgi:hypothetical protein